MKKTTTILDKIIGNKKLELIAAKREFPLMRLKNSIRTTDVRSFINAIGKKNKLNLIAEIKKSSPSGGLIRKDFNHLSIAAEYQQSGLVDAISVLTEKKYFQGAITFIREVKKVTSVPILRKDFVFDEYQIYESNFAGADALLLIVTVLDPSKLKGLLGLTHRLGMDALVEVHTEKEVEIALKAGAKIIGINARDLKTFKVDNTLLERLSKYIPREIIKVAESGLEQRKDLERVYSSGANAVLIGTSIMKVKDIQSKIKDLVGDGLKRGGY